MQADQLPEKSIKDWKAKFASVDNIDDILANSPPRYLSHLFDFVPMRPCDTFTLHGTKCQKAQNITFDVSEMTLMA